MHVVHVFAISLSYISGIMNLALLLLEGWEFGLSLTMYLFLFIIKHFQPFLFLKLF